MASTERVRHRYARPEDAESIATYHARCWQLDYRGLLPDEVVDAMQLPRTLPEWQAFLAPDQADGDGQTIVAVIDERAIGHITVGPGADDGRGEVHALYVDPDHRRAGIGTTLLTMGSRLLRRAGCAVAELWTFPDNQQAIDFYQTMGWHADGTTENKTVVGGAAVEHLRLTMALDDNDHALHNRTYWDDQAAGYVAAGRAAWAREAPNWGIFATPDEVAGMMPEVSGRDVVELGCGAGYVSAWCMRAGANHVVGLDNSPAQLATATALQTEFDLRFPLLLADAEHAPCADQSFDVAISEYGASLWCDPYRWIPEAARLLRPGGQLVFLTNSIFAALAINDFEDIPATAQLQRPLKGMHRLGWPDIEGSEFHLAHGEMIRLLRASGFEVIDLVELYAGEDDTSSYSFVTPEWASQWPHEEVWTARRLG